MCPLRASVGLCAALLVSCSLGNPSRDDCSDSNECRGLFGAGFYCADTGLCESVLTERCPEMFPADAADDTDAVLFGTIFARTTPNQQARERAARLAVDGINERSGIDGRRVALLHCDADTATDAADYLVTQVQVPAIIGPSSSSETEAAFSAHRDAGVLFMTPSATAIQLRDIDPVTPGRLWRTAPPDDLQAQVILDDMQARGLTRVSVVSKQNDTYAQSLSILLQQGAADRSITVQETPQFGDLDAIAGAASSALGSAPPDAVVFLSFRVGDAAAFLDAATQPAYESLDIYLTDAAANEELLTRTSAGDAVLGQVRLTRPAAPSTVITSEFVSSYTAEFGEPPLQFSFTAHTYDAAAMVILGAGFALGESDVLVGDDIARGIAQLSGGAQTRELVSASFTAAIEDLRSGTALDIVGASGELDYDPTTEELSTATYEILTITPMPRGFSVEASVDVP